MLILLPPSEAKASRARGGAVDLDGLSSPALTAARLEVLTALADVSARADAAAVLGVGASLADEVDRNTRWRTEPALAVSRLYTGVLYDALDHATLPPAGRRRAASSLAVVSAAWGLLTPSDKVPPYRLSMGVDLPGVGPLAAHWRRHLDTVLPERAGTGVVVDCRSSTYAAAWRPGPGTGEQVVPVRVLRDAGGRLTVVSHMAKHTRGLVARHLLGRPGRAPRTPEQLASAVGEVLDVTLGPPARTGSRTLDVIVRDDAT